MIPLDEEMGKKLAKVRKDYFLSIVKNTSKDKRRKEKSPYRKKGAGPNPCPPAPPEKP
jgi:hypothetical protein